MKIFMSCSQTVVLASLQSDELSVHTGGFLTYFIMMVHAVTFSAHYFPGCSRCHGTGRKRSLRLFHIFLGKFLNY